jgi:hypothetical protein
VDFRTPHFEHRSNARTDSSTAGLVFVGSWLIGIPIAVVSVAIDASLRERVVRRKAA